MMMDISSHVSAIAVLIAASVDEKINEVIEDGFRSQIVKAVETAVHDFDYGTSVSSEIESELASISISDRVGSAVDTAIEEYDFAGKVGAAVSEAIGGFDFGAVIAAAVERKVNDGVFTKVVTDSLLTSLDDPDVLDRFVRAVFDRAAS